MYGLPIYLKEKLKKSSPNSPHSKTPQKTESLPLPSASPSHMEEAISLLRKSSLAGPKQLQNTLQNWQKSLGNQTVGRILRAAKKHTITPTAEKETESTLPMPPMMEPEIALKQAEFGGLSALGLPVGEIARLANSEQIARNPDGTAQGVEPASAFKHATSGSAREVPYRQEMESAFGVSFRNVKAYVGRTASEGLNLLGAEAAAFGDKVAFQSSNPSKETVAHELTHVVQQGGSHSSATLPTKMKVSHPNDPAEREADAVGKQFSK
ncbi:MAG: DUF4157 domain-containing protein [Planctomycetota bacterium]|nr:MAG: DUF4157 domain-containing protein [Planctomycetota bacterium]